MMCSGIETVVVECMFDGVDGDSNCNHESDLFISCQRQCLSTIITKLNVHTVTFGE